jgi:DNA repair exonuclease SbcCD ATPase subunit
MFQVTLDHAQVQPLESAPLIDLANRWRNKAYEQNHKIRDLEAERDKLIRAIADHVTVRGEYYDKIRDLEARLKAAEEERDESRVNVGEVSAELRHYAEQAQAMHEAKLAERMHKIADKVQALELEIIALKGRLGHPVPHGIDLPEVEDNALAKFIGKERDSLKAQLHHRHIVGKAYEVSRESIDRLAGELEETKAENESLKSVRAMPPNGLRAEVKRLRGHIAKLERALKKIVYFVHPHRDRGWHVYPTELRDNAIGVFLDAEIEVKTYDECEAETIEALKGEPHDEQK